MSTDMDTAGGNAKSYVGRLRFRLVMVALLSMLIVISATGYGIHRIYAQHVLFQAEEDAVHISEALFVELRDLLLAAGPDGTSALSIDSDRRALLDRRLRRFLHPFNIVKIKIYDDQGEILYSTDPAVIGEVDVGNARLLRALLGTVDSHQERKETVRDLADEQKFDVDVVETYVPIRLGGEVVGSFEIYLDVTRYRDDIASGVGTSIAVLAGILLLVFAVAFLFVMAATARLATAETQLRTLAMRDVMTGTLNRGTILAYAREEFARIDRRRQQRDYALSFILLDIDHFKKVNDTFGHLAGDQVLRDLAGRVQGALRSYDLLGRYGGEEFLVVLPDATLEGATVVAERVRQTVSAAPFVFEEASVDVTVSLGVATSETVEEDLAEVLKRADKGLYLAKDGGRNRVACVEAAALS